MGLPLGADVGADVVGVSLGLAVGATDKLYSVSYSNAILQLVRVPISRTSESRIAITHSVLVPELGVEYRVAKFAALDRYPVGPTLTLAVAAKVPVNGALLLLNLEVLPELTTVLTRLAPLRPLCLLNRFRILPFGAWRLITISLIHGCVILIVTLKLVIFAPTGKATAIP